jgi:exodeoxyribonuclease V alpha subunit
MRHLVDSGVLPVTVLNKIFRQEEGSGIVQIAHLVNRGVIPGRGQFVKDCLFFQEELPAQAVAKVVELVNEMRRTGIEPQVISPCTRGRPGRTG